MRNNEQMCVAFHNSALNSNQGGIYDDILQYSKLS